MRDLGSRAAMRWGSSPHARTTSEQTALHCVPRQSRGTFVPLRLFLLFKTATAALGCGFVFWAGPTAPRCIPRLCRGTFVPLRLFLLLKTATAALGCGFVFLGGAGGLLCPAVPRGFAAGHALRFGLPWGRGSAGFRCAPRLRRGTCAALGFIMRDKQRAACGAALWGFMGIYSASATLSTP